jgi:FlaA1/EpsC-like NDP-sugar epimerase
VVFHAAAYKTRAAHGERERLAGGVETNVGRHARARPGSGSLGVEKFVFVSTDKAVNPTSVMGASKRLAEMVCSHAASARIRVSWWSGSGNVWAAREA